MWIRPDRDEPGAARSAGSFGRLPRRGHPCRHEAGPAGPLAADARAIAEDLTIRKGAAEPGLVGYDPTDPVGRLLFNVLAMVAESEADLTRSRTREGMRVAKAKGHLRGKQPKLNPRQEAHLVELLHTGEYSTAEIGDLFGVARSTVYRAVARSKKGQGIAHTAAAKLPAPPGVQKPATGDRDHNSLTITYRPRHGAPNEIPSEDRGGTRARSARPASAPRTGR